MNIESDDEGKIMADTGDASTVFDSIITEASADRGDFQAVEKVVAVEIV